MPTYIMLTRLNTEVAHSPKSLEQLERAAMDHVRKECPEAEWLASYAILGPSDYLDIFQAPDNEAAMRVSALIRTFGHAQTEVWGATEWSRFKEVMRANAQPAKKEEAGPRRLNA